MTYAVVGGLYSARIVAGLATCSVHASVSANRYGRGLRDSVASWLLGPTMGKLGEL